MNRRVFRILLALLMVAFAGVVRAAPVAAFSLDPFVDDQTFLAARVDVTKIDTAVIVKFLTDVVGPADDGSLFTVARVAVDGVLARLKQLGVHNAYAVMSHPDVWPALQPIAVLLPLEPGQDPKPLIDALNAFDLDAKASLLRDNVVFFGQDVPLRRLQTLKPQLRPELTKPLDGSSPIQIVLSGTADARRVVAEMMPQLPNVPEIPGIGGRSTDFYSKGFVNLIIALDLPPNADLRLSANFSNPADAVELTQILQALMQAVVNDHGYQDQVRTSPVGPQMRALTEEITRQLAASPDPASPASVSIHFNSDQFRALIQVLMPAVGQIQQKAGQAASMNNLRQIAMACNVYENDHKNSWPDSLDTIRSYVTTDQVFVNPADPQHRRYILHPWTSEQIAALQKTDKSATTPIVYEATDADNALLNVAYLDGHVERWQSKKALDEQIAAAEAAIKK